METGVTSATTGATPSMVIFLLLSNEIGLEMVRMASFPEPSLIVPPFKDSAPVPVEDRCAEVLPAVTV